MSILKKTLPVIGACTVVVVGFVSIVSAISIFTTKPPVTQPKAVLATIPAPLPPDASTLFTLVNQQRVANGLSALIDNPKLDASATAKCSDMVLHNYWAHDDPVTGTTPWDFMHQQGVYFTTAGENLAEGHFTSESMVTSWMNSPEHRSNILNANYHYVGYDICHSDNFDGNGSVYVTVQHFTN